MKQIYLVVLLFFVAFGLVTIVVSGAHPALAADDPELGPCLEAIFSEIAPGELSAEEEAGILYMREEEKLARDVYNRLGELWGIPIFSNIARSEETHMDAMLVLIDRYGLSDPVDDDTPGVFEDPALQSLYDELTASGSVSLTYAFRVGALIEELDIADLKDHLEMTDNDDVRIVYQNLMRGSRNHLRSFYRQLNRSGVDYKPTYLSMDEFSRIITSPRETGGAIDDPNYRFE
ncbi:MAG: DUF2202 domain-containing protein [Deltaproteobacteria bacterium]|nr:DUF2202 domain-containing protein [Candidatus Zymogenaceae bacterium]